MSTDVENVKRKTSLRSDTVIEGHIYDFEIYKNGGDTVIRANATVIKNPGFHIRDYGSDDFMLIKVDGEEEERKLVKSSGKPFFLITRVDDKRNCRVRFHSDITPIDEETSQENVQSDIEEKELVEA